MPQGDVPNFWMAGLQMLAALSLVLGLLFAVLWAVRRLSGRVRTDSGPSINILCARNIGPKKQVLLLEVMGRRILVGAGPDAITRLAVFPAGETSFAKSLEGAVEQQSSGEKPEETERAMAPDAFGAGEES